MLLFNVGVKAVISAIDERLSLLDSQDADECECGLEALGQIGSCKYISLVILFKITFNFQFYEFGN